MDNPSLIPESYLINIPTISAEEFSKLENVFIIDVRKKIDFEEINIKGSWSVFF